MKYWVNLDGLRCNWCGRVPFQLLIQDFASKRINLGTYATDLNSEEGGNVRRSYYKLKLHTLFGGYF